jgi:hypothetical protein
MRFIIEVTVNSSYVSTMLLFSVLSWEIGFLMENAAKEIVI